MNFDDQKSFFLSSAPWCLDHLEINHSELILSGWVVPKNGDWNSVEFFINDKPYEFEYRMKRSDLLNVFPFWQGVAEIGFQIKLKREFLDPNDKMVILSRGPNCENSKYSDYYFPLNDSNYKNLPPANLRTQVHGSDSVSSFVLEGFSCYKKINFLVDEHLDKSFEQIFPVLDWGCGCGRVSKYFFEKSDIFGVDINKNAVDWCVQNLSPNYSVSELNPPLSFPENHFELIYGVSILTHLSFEDQRNWIEELIRVTRKGGIIILSYHGLNSLIRFNLPQESFSQLNETKYLNIGKSDSLGKDSEVGSRYYDAVQLASSFNKIISQSEIELSFHSGVFGNHQDVVVIKKL
jgi:SAM-dependent methyltransferase